MVVNMLCILMQFFVLSKFSVSHFTIILKRNLLSNPSKPFNTQFFLGKSVWMNWNLKVIFQGKRKQRNLGNFLFVIITMMIFACHGSWHVTACEGYTRNVCKQLLLESSHAGFREKFWSTENFSRLNSFEEQKRIWYYVMLISPDTVEDIDEDKEESDEQSHPARNDFRFNEKWHPWDSNEHTWGQVYLNDVLHLFTDQLDLEPTGSIRTYQKYKTKKF